MKGILMTENFNYYLGVNLNHVFLDLAVCCFQAKDGVLSLGKSLVN